MGSSFRRGMLQNFDGFHAHTSVGGWAHLALETLYQGSLFAAHRVMNPGAMTHVCHTYDGDNIG